MSEIVDLLFPLFETKKKAFYFYCEFQFADKKLLFSVQTYNFISISLTASSNVLKYQQFLTL